MKKLFVVLLTAMLLLGISLVSDAAINWSGELETGYKFLNKDGYNKLTLEIDSKVSDSVTAYAKLEGYSDELTVDEAYFVANTAIGKFSFGNWEQKFSGVNGHGELEVLDYLLMIPPFFIIGDEPIDPAFAVKWAPSRIPDGMILELGYGRENAVIWATLGYATEKWGVNYSYIHQYQEFEPFDITPKYYYANAFLKPIENITLYAHFFDYDFESLNLPPGVAFALDSAIIGVYGEFGKFFARYEYDTNDKSISLPELSVKGHSFGYEIGYNFSNKVTAYYEYSNLLDSDYNQVLYLKVKFK